MSAMFKIEVGELYHPAMTRWLEGNEYNYRSGMHELLLRFGTPTADEIEAVQSGRAQYALAVTGDVIWFLFRYEGLQWQDAAYSWHLVPEVERRLPEPMPSETHRMAIHTVLIDADTGIVKALRYLTFTPVFTHALHEAIKKQAAMPWPGREAYDAQIADIYTRYTTEQMVRKLAHVQCDAP